MIKLLVDFLNLLQIGKQLAHDRIVRQGKQLHILHQSSVWFSRKLIGNCVAGLRSTGSTLLKIASPVVKIASPDRGAHVWRWWRLRCWIEEQQKPCDERVRVRSDPIWFSNYFLFFIFESTNKKSMLKFSQETNKGYLYNWFVILLI